MIGRIAGVRWREARKFSTVELCCIWRRATLFYFPRRHQRASTRARKRGAAPYATKFNSAELSRFTPAIQPIVYRCQELSLQRIELAITSVSSLLGNQLVASGSQRACDHGQRAVATPRVKLSFSFLYPFSIHWIDFILIDS